MYINKHHGGYDKGKVTKNGAIEEELLRIFTPGGGSNSYFARVMEFGFSL